jgi:lysyl-tRNA synthetase class 1
MTKIDIEAEKKSNLWIWKEAFALKERMEKNPPAKGYVLFETGYGPSGLPHIGTFGEVFRTTLVRRAFERISDLPTKLFAFSDDMDGLRKVPDNIPNREMVAEHIGKALTAIPDPFGTHESFGAHMNARLRMFLDSFGFDYEFKSSTECYRSGIFDEALLNVLKNYDAIQKIMLPTLGEERQKTYSPFMPVEPGTNKVLQVPIISIHPEKGTIIYRKDSGEEVETTVTGGNCKLQWKPDWGMRWAALGVDYEMHGKDLTPSVEVSSKICKAIKGAVPRTFVYEMFLDELGQKISKSKGNGISLDEWLEYGTPESLSLYMLQAPQKAKKLYFDIIPKSVDEYIAHTASAHKPENADKLLDNPAWHIHNGNVPEYNLPISFALLLNLASASNPESKSVMWGFINRYTSGGTPETMPYLDRLVEHAIKYYEFFVKPNKKFRPADDKERAAILELKDVLKVINLGSTPEEIQSEVYNIGKKHGFENLADWFKALYQVLLGSDQGPRMGSFIKLYGIDETVRLISEKVG